MVQHHFSLHLEMATQTLLLFYWRLVLTPVSQHLMVALLCGWLHMEATRRYCNSWFDIILVNVQQPQSPWISWHHCILDSTELKISCYSNSKLYMMYTPRTQTTHTLEDLTHRNVSRSTPPKKGGTNRGLRTTFWILPNVHAGSEMWRWMWMLKVDVTNKNPQGIARRRQFFKYCSRLLQMMCSGRKQIYQNQRYF